MKTRILTGLNVWTGLVLLLALLPGGTGAIMAQGSEPPALGSHKPLYLAEGAPGPRQKSPEGLWAAPNGYHSPANRSGISPNATGGPDDFGYTWDDSVPLNWLDASGGTETGLNGGADYVGPIGIGFSFKYYENTYSQLYISRFGFLAFNNNDMWNDQSRIPSTEKPNDVIAPHWVPVDSVNGYVRYLMGGSAPNRWFLVEWNRLASDCCEGDAAEEYTFEAILHENGDIVFQYGAMTVDGGYWCQASGIEDSTGLDGLSITNFCAQIAPNHAVHIYRPAPSARVRVLPLYQGRFTHAGETVAFQVPIRNTGELGADTYDLTTASTWPVSLYAADGCTPLTDTDTDGVVDTGPVIQGGSTTITVKVLSPTLANVGDHNSAAITVHSSLDVSKSKTPTVQTTIPTPFAQVYDDYADGAMSLDLVRPNIQVTKKTTSDWYYGSNVAVAEMPNSFAYFWSRSHSESAAYVQEIEYTLLDSHGNTTRPIGKLTDHTGAILDTYDNRPAVAVAPDGHIGVVWSRYLWNDATSQYNYNIYFAILDNTGNLIYGPLNVTNNSAWGDWDDYNIPYFGTPRIAASQDNRFILAWLREHLASPGGGCTEDCYVDDIYYAIRDTVGTEVRPVTQSTFDTPGWEQGYYYPGLTELTGNQVLLLWGQDSDGDIYYSVLDSSGNVVRTATNLSTGMAGWSRREDAVQLSDGRTIVAWTGGSSPNYQIYFAALDTSYNRVAGPTVLNNPAAPTGNDYVSVAAAQNRAVLTWMDSNSSSRHNLYYTLVDGSGSILTQPAVFHSSQASDPYVMTSYEGYGNTSYSLIPPTSGQVDGRVTAAPMAGGPPGGTAAALTAVGNYGLTTATSVVLSAELDSNLSYVKASPTPSSVSGDLVTWNLPDLDFLGGGQVVLYTTVPSVPIGTRYPVTWTLASAGPEANPADNMANTEVTAARELFLPLILKNH